MPINKIPTSATKIVADSILNKLIDPVIAKLKLYGKKKLQSKKSHFKDYLERSCYKYSQINTFVFKSKINLKEVYIPLTIISSKKELVRIDKYPSEIMVKYQKIKIIDSAGMGKSTQSKIIFLDCVKHLPAFPILIELRRLNSNNSISDEILKQLNSVDKVFDKTLLNSFIKEGIFLFILDGFDEIPLDEKSFVTKELQDFITKCGKKNKFILTSRQENVLTSFNDFESFKIKPLEKKEAYELFKKYDNDGSLAPLLIKKINEIRDKGIKEFLVNPLLVSLLYKSFDYKHTIPLKKTFILQASL